MESGFRVVFRTSKAHISTASCSLCYNFGPNEQVALVPKNIAFHDDVSSAFIGAISFPYDACQICWKTSCYPLHLWAHVWQSRIANILIQADVNASIQIPDAATA